VLPCRLDLNHPPISVGGISDITKLLELKEGDVRITVAREDYETFF
jgi:hypothetical protein